MMMVQPMKKLLAKVLRDWMKLVETWLIPPLKISQYILDAYDTLANMEDKNVFVDLPCD